tara:strand:- start:569 stop:772 length:204 start_codon:yes stop_codon:yes gene_type:complete
MQYLTNFLPEYLKPATFSSDLLMKEMTEQLNDLSDINQSIELPAEVRLRIYSYFTLNELIEVVINLS